MRHRRPLALLALLVVAGAGLAGCRIDGPELETRIAAVDGAALMRSGKAVVVISAGSEMGDAVFTRTPATSLHWTLAGADGKPDIARGFTVEGTGAAAKPRIVEIEPGSYLLATFAFGPYRNAGGHVGLPPAMFRAAAGEVLYLGHVRIVAEQAGLLASSNRNYTIDVQSKEAEARAALAENHPGLAAAMQSRPVTVNPLVAGR